MHVRAALLFPLLLALLSSAGCCSALGAHLPPTDGADLALAGSASDELTDHESQEHHEHGEHHAHEAEELASPPGTTSHRAPISGHAHLHPNWDDAHAHAPRLLLRTNLRRGWCEPAEHYHASVCGTPYVHGFLTEPAFLGRDLFVDVTRSDDETEIEVELEWSLTKRLGLIAELPYADADESGIGDAALGLRALLIEERRLLLSASTEIELPTGSESKGLGSGSLAVGASLHTWIDLGSWVTLQTVTGIEHVPDEDETEFKWSLALAKSFPACPLLRIPSCGAHDHGPSAFSLIAEIQGHTALSDDAGTTEGRWLLGASYPLTKSIDLRGAFSRTFGGDEDEEAWTLGLIFHL